MSLVDISIPHEPVVAPSSTHPYSPSTSAKINISTIPTKMRDWRMYARTP
jgi:hypothetical protein